MKLYEIILFLLIPRKLIKFSSKKSQMKVELLRLFYKNFVYTFAYWEKVEFKGGCNISHIVTI